MSIAQSLVVLVEPEIAIARALESSLREAGFHVLATRDGEECLRILEEETSPIAAVLAEITMPGVGGREIAAVMAEYRPEVPVLLITSEPPGIETAPRPDSPPATPPLDSRNAAEMVRQLRATMERMERTRQRFRAARQSMKPLLEEGRRLRSEQSNLIAAVRALAARRSSPACPQCGSSRVATMLYGSERLNRRDQLASGKVVLGGAHRGDGDPAWHCRDCEYRW